MNINSNFTSIQAQHYNKKAATPAFGQKYQFGDVMTIMSGAFAHNIDSVDKTVADLLGKKVGNTMEKTCDYFQVKKILNKKYPELKEAANSFYDALSAKNPNHLSIDKDDAARIVAKEAEKFGRKFIDIEL